MNTLNSPIRVVLAATHVVEHDLGTSPDMPGCLLPCGTQTLIERMLDQFARNGLRQIDLIVSDQPDELRKLVGNGERWGLQIAWHWVQDNSRTYGTLRSFDWNGVEKILFARAEQWISERALTQLIESDNLLLVRADQPSVWTGWACCDTGLLNILVNKASASEVGDILQAHASTARKMALREDWAAPVTAADLVCLQQRALSTQGLDCAPATWIPKPWGIMSPQAWIDPKAFIQGPAIVGPGCFICADARIGANVVLTKDVIVDNDVYIAETLVMPDVYLGHRAEFRHTLISGGRVLHVKSRTSSLLPDLRAHRRVLRCDMPEVGWVSRTLALAALALFAPLVAMDGVVRSSRKLPPRWNTQPVVHGYLSQNNGLRIHLLNEPAPQSSFAGQCLAQYGRLIDIAQGKRHWFGVRARTLGQWQRLSNDWQGLLARAPIGLINASAWHEPGQPPCAEAQAAADVFFAVSPSWKLRLRMCAGLFHRPSSEPGRIAGAC